MSRIRKTVAWCAAGLVLGGAVWLIASHDERPPSKDPGGTLSEDPDGVAATSDSVAQQGFDPPPFIPGESLVYARAEFELSFATHVAGGELYQEYQRLLEVARSDGTRASCLPVFDLFSTITAELLQNSAEGASSDPTNEKIAAAAAMVERFESDFKALPQYEAFPDLYTLAYLLLTITQFKLNDPNVYKVANSPARLQLSVSRGAPAEALDNAYPGIRALYKDEGEAEAVLELISDLEKAPAYEDVLLEKYRQWYMYLAKINIQQASPSGRVSIDFGAASRLIHVLSLPPEASREEQLLAAKIDATAFAFMARNCYFFGGSQLWDGPSDIIDWRDRKPSERGFPVAEALFRLDQLELDFADVIRESDRHQMALLRQSVNPRFLEERLLEDN